MSYFKKLFCNLNKHKGWVDVFVRNVYGDEINFLNGKRSIWKCTHCNGEILKDYLWKEHKSPSQKARKYSRWDHDRHERKDGRFCEELGVSYDDVHDFDK